MGRGLRECQVRLVTYFWSSKEFRTRGAGGDLCGLPRSPLSSAARPVPGAPSPQSVARAGRGRLPRLRGRWPRGCSNHRPAERSRTSPGKVPADSPAGRAGGRAHERSPAATRVTVSGAGVGSVGGECAGAHGTDPDLARPPGHGALGAPGDRCLLRSLPGAALGAAAAAHAGICGSGPLEVAEHLCLPGAQPAHGARGAARVRGLEVREGPG